MAETTQSTQDETETVLDFDMDELDDMALRQIAEKVYEKLRRDLMVEQERIGRTNQWSGWMR